MWQNTLLCGKTWFIPLSNMRCLMNQNLMLGLGIFLVTVLIPQGFTAESQAQSRFQNLRPIEMLPDIQIQLSGFDKMKLSYSRDEGLTKSGAKGFVSVFLCSKEKKRSPLALAEEGCFFDKEYRLEAGRSPTLSLWELLAAGSLLGIHPEDLYLVIAARSDFSSVYHLEYDQDEQGTQHVETEWVWSAENPNPGIFKRVLNFFGVLHLKGEYRSKIITDIKFTTKHVDEIISKGENFYTFVSPVLLKLPLFKPLKIRNLNTVTSYGQTEVSHYNAAQAKGRDEERLKGAHYSKSPLQFNWNEEVAFDDTKKYGDKEISISGIVKFPYSQAVNTMWPKRLADPKYSSINFLGIYARLTSKEQSKEAATPTLKNYIEILTMNSYLNTETSSFKDDEEAVRAIEGSLAQLSPREFWIGAARLMSNTQDEITDAFKTRKIGVVSAMDSIYPSKSLVVNVDIKNETQVQNNSTTNLTQNGPAPAAGQGGNAQAGNLIDLAEDVGDFSIFSFEALKQTLESMGK